MCGISVVINGTLDDISKMSQAISRRGVKTSIVKIHESYIGFNHLPIVGDVPQPAEYSNVICFLNGFISNWKELRDKYKYNCINDTEFLARFLTHNHNLKELNGFFSVVYFQDGIKYFTDRYGIKQLYKHTEGDKTFICSEIKGILAVSTPSINQEAVDDWKYSLGVMTESIYNIERVPKLEWVKPNKIEIPYLEAKKELLRLWKQSVKRNQYKDAGVLLSGGIDSGMIAQWFDPAYSFSMDYQDDLSEIENIKINSTGTHYTLIHNESTFDTFAPKTVEALDTPKVGSCYTNYAIMELASKFTKVVYSGAGADEIFQGYGHRYDKDINEVIKRVPTKTKEYNITHKEYDWKFLEGILIVEDRMAGANTLETRYPFLDNDFVDFALSLPNEYLRNKWILKNISGLPQEILSGRKRGFSNPITNKEWIDYYIKCKGL